MREVVADSLVTDHARRGGRQRLLHRQHNVVLQRLCAALDEQGVGAKARRADPEPRAPGDVLDPVGDAVLALDLGDRFQIALVRVQDGAALVVVELPDARTELEPALAAVERRQPLQQVQARVHPRPQQHVAEYPDALSSVIRKSRSTSDPANSRTVST
jgi:hypothetical protein